MYLEYKQIITFGEDRKLRKLINLTSTTLIMTQVL